MSIALKKVRSLRKRTSGLKRSKRRLKRIKGGKPWIGKRVQLRKKKVLRGGLRRKKSILKHRRRVSAIAHPPVKVIETGDPAGLYQQGYNQTYQEGFNTGFAQGFEDGHKLAYHQQEIK